MLAFCHMIKCAGTTLTHIFRNNYGFNYVEVYSVQGKKDSFGLDLFYKDDIKFFLKRNKNIRCIRGHCLRTYSEINHILPDVKYFTFLRNPVSRYISHYFYGKSHDFDNENFRDWMRSKRRELRNYQTKFIAGEENLEKAKNILEYTYNFVGFVEEFDTSLLLMKNLLDLPSLDIRYKRRNIGSYNKKDFFQDDLEEKIVDENRLDIALYNFAVKEIFEKQKQIYNGDLKKDLKEFKTANQNYRTKKIKNFQYLLGKHFIYSNPCEMRKQLKIFTKHNVIPMMKHSK